MRQFGALALVIGLALGGQASGQAPPTRAQLNGEWTGTLVLDNSSPRITLVFQVTDSAFAGKVYADGDLFGAMERGSVVANRVHFVAGGLDYTGTIVGSTMKVDLIVYNGSTRTFTMRKTPNLPSDSAARHPQARLSLWRDERLEWRVAAE